VHFYSCVTATIWPLLVLYSLQRPTGRGMWVLWVLSYPILLHEARGACVMIR